MTYYINKIGIFFNSSHVKVFATQAPTCKLTLSLWTVDLLFSLSFDVLVISKQLKNKPTAIKQYLIVKILLQSPSLKGKILELGSHFTLVCIQWSSWPEWKNPWGPYWQQSFLNQLTLFNSVSNDSIRMSLPKNPFAKTFSITVYRISPPISPRLIWVRKAFWWVCLQEGLCAGHKRPSEPIAIIRQNENLYLKKWRKCAVLFVYLLMKENLYLKPYFSGSRIKINALIRVGLCVGGFYEGGELIRGVTQVLKKRWAYLQAAYMRGGGGGAYRRRNQYDVIITTLTYLEK